MRLFSLVFLSALGACQRQQQPTATTRNGTYVGRYLAEFDQDLFLGIPYARSPRLNNPQPWNESWKGVRSAEFYGSICHCGATAQVMEATNVTGKSEECLNLNIIRPRLPRGLQDKNPRLPVAVWLYGGAFGDGFGADLNSNYSWFVRESVERRMPVMAITLNYRVGFLGFPGGEEAFRAGVTNLGLKDQRQALRWIRENIASFGGDPDKVTLWGQSAGAQSIAYQLMTPSTEPLFSRAIMISSSVGIGNTVLPTHPSAVEGYAHILNATNCTDLTCLRGTAVPIDKLWSAATSISTIATWWPSIDGAFVTEPPSLTLLSSPSFPNNKNIILLIGTNSDEGFAYTNLMNPAFNTSEELSALLRRSFKTATDESIADLLTLYPITDPAPPYSLPLSETDRFCAALKEKSMSCGAQYRRVAAILGDFGLLHGRRLFARRFAKLGIKVYSYRFDAWPTSFPITTGEVKPGFAGHGSDYAYWFGWPRDYELYGNNPEVASGRGHERLQGVMVSRLVGFVSGGDPNLVTLPDVPTWPLYTTDNPSNIVFNATGDTLDVHIEPDTWREKGMAIWAERPLEFDLAGSVKPWLVES